MALFALPGLLACTPDFPPSFDGVPGEPIDTAPAWSPDGRSIAYAHWARTPREYEEGGGTLVFVVDRMSGERRFVGVGDRPCWSPSGDTLAYLRQGVVHYFTPSRDPWSVVPLEGVESIDWSAATGRIAFARYDDTGRPAVGSIAPNGSDVRWLAAEAFDPVWAAAGDSIVHVRREWGFWPGELRIMAADGSGSRPLVAGSSLDWRPACSPRGDLVAWARYRSDFETEVWVAPSDGAEPRRLLRHATAPSWSPDGDSLVVVTRNLNRRVVLKIVSAGTGLGRFLTH
jgi:Tol biopolymer transport system component